MVHDPSTPYEINPVWSCSGLNLSINPPVRSPPLQLSMTSRSIFPPFATLDLGPSTILHVSTSERSPASWRRRAANPEHRWFLNLTPYPFDNLLAETGIILPTTDGKKKVKQIVPPHVYQSVLGANERNPLGGDTPKGGVQQRTSSDRAERRRGSDVCLDSSGEFWICAGRPGRGSRGGGGAVDPIRSIGAPNHLL